MSDGIEDRPVSSTDVFVGSRTLLFQGAEAVGKKKILIIDSC